MSVENSLSDENSSNSELTDTEQNMPNLLQENQQEIKNVPKTKKKNSNKKHKISTKTSSHLINEEDIKKLRNETVQDYQQNTDEEEFLRDQPLEIQTKIRYFY